MKKNKKFLAAIFFLVLTAFSLRSIFFKLGIIGHTWDWWIPNFSPQYFNLVKNSIFSSWNNSAFGGTFIQLKTEVAYCFLIWTYSFLGGEAVSKITPFLLLSISFLIFFLLAKKIFKLSAYWAGMAATLYSLSPFFYSRLIAGHLSYLMAYIMIPLLCFALFKNNLILAILVFPFLTGAPNIVVIAAILVVLFFFFSLINSWKKTKVLTNYLLLCLGFCLVGCYSFILFLNSSNIQFKVMTDVSSQEYLIGQVEYLNQHSQPLINIITLNFANNLYTEFVYPFPEYLKPFYILIVLLLFGLSFSSLFILKKNRKVVFFSLILCLGVILSCGTKTILGKIFYSLLFKFLPPVFAGFVNALRFLPLVFLPLSILCPLVLQTIESKFINSNKTILKIIVVIFGLIFFYPWFFRPLTKPLYEQDSQPLSLQLNKIDPEEKKVFDYIASFPEDFRITFLPPYFISWPGPTNFSYTWNFGFYSKPTFLEGLHPALAKATIEQLYSPNSIPQLGKLLGLANVKMIIYPHYQPFGSYHNFIPGETNYQKIIDHNLGQQKGLELIKTDFQTVDIYENRDFLPHFYIPSQIIYTNANENILPEIVSSTDYQLDSAIFLNQAQIQNKTTNMEYSFNLDETKESEAYLLKEKSWLKLDKADSSKKENNLVINLPSAENLIQQTCQNAPNNPQLVVCNVKNYSPATSLKLSFSYSCSQGKPLFALVEDDQQTPLIEQTLAKTKPNEIKEVSTVFKTRPSANTAKLYLFVEAENNQPPNFTIKNLNLTAEPNLMIKNKLYPPNLPQITFTKINPTKYQVLINQAKEPYYLIFSETYRSEWQLSQNNKPIASNTHKLVNGFANSWYIIPQDVNNQPHYELTVEFLPQRIYSAGLLISFITFITGLIYLFYKTISHFKKHDCQSKKIFKK